MNIYKVNGSFVRWITSIFNTITYKNIENVEYNEDRANIICKDGDIVVVQVKSLARECRKLLEKNNKLRAVKYARDNYFPSLKEAKEFVDKL